VLSEHHACFVSRYSFSPSILLIPCAPWAWWPCCALRGIGARKVGLLTQLSFLLHWYVTRPFWRWNGLVRIATRLKGGQLKSRGSNGTGGKKLFPSPKRPHLFWGSSTLILSGCLGLFPQERNGHVVNLTTHLCLWPSYEQVELYLHSPMFLYGVYRDNIAFTFTCPVFWTALCRLSCKGGEDAGGHEETRRRKLSEGRWYLHSLLILTQFWIFWCMALGRVPNVWKEVAVTFFFQCGHLFRWPTEQAGLTILKRCFQTNSPDFHLCLFVQRMWQK